MRKSASSLVLAALLALGADSAWASTPDGQTPAVETVCDAEVGAAFGLCNAYCEAMDCDSPNHRASDRACEVVGENFTERTGRPLPCDVTCPCADTLLLFRAIVDGSKQVERCTIDEGAVIVTTVEETSAAVITSPSQCVELDELGFVEGVVDLDATQRQVCRVLLRTASEAQLVPCFSPE